MICGFHTHAVAIDCLDKPFYLSQFNYFLDFFLLSNVVHFYFIDKLALQHHCALLVHCFFVV